MKKILFLSIVLLSLVACSKGESKAEKQTEKRDSIITYTTSNGNIVDINNKNVFGAAITSNIYGHEGGKIVFDGPVTSIGYEAFAGCSSLTSITIPNGVKSIGERAFEGCKSLTSVTIPNSVTRIGDGAFDDCRSLTSVTIPNSVTRIGDEAFEGCKSLTSVTIPNNVTRIGHEAFAHCSSLKSVTIPNSVTSIGLGAFKRTALYNNPANWKNGALYIDDCLIKVDGGFAGHFRIKENTRVIADEAFAWCESLTSVTIPNSVTRIGDAAFEGCSSLTSVTIPNGVKEIGEGAFDGCGLLSSPIPPNLMSEEEKIRERNMLDVKINAANELLVEGEILDISQLREKAKEFIVNPNNDENMPELFEEDFGAPFGKIKITKGHVISLQSAVDTKYEAYLEVQNALGRAYNEIRDECAQKYYHKKYKELDEEQQKKIQEIYPQKISEAEPRKYRVR